MCAKAKILLVAAFVLSSATAALAQSRYYQVPTEQQPWYDRNAAGINV